ncbi:MAG TPA: phage tail protein [Longimicrobium sp.]|nr:phage tail protein [Longimicrobium sp.]
MDVNGTRFHLLLGRDDWVGARGPAARAEWADGALGLQRLPVVFPARGLETPPTQDDRRGAGRDSFGNWYVIGADGRSIVARSHHDHAEVRFWPPAAPPACADAAPGGFAPAVPPPAPEPVRLRGLAVTGDHYLVAGTLEPAGLLVFDLAAGGPPVALPWPAAVPFAPWDVAAAPGGGAWVLDRDNARLWALDRHFRVVSGSPLARPAPAAPDFVPASASPDACDALGDAGASADAVVPITLDASLPIPEVEEPVAVDALCDGSALVLGRDGASGAAAIHRYALDGAHSIHPLAPLLGDVPEVLADLARAFDFAFVPAAGCSKHDARGTAYLVSPSGNQGYAFTLAGEAGALEIGFGRDFHPMRRFGGRALVAAGGEAWYDGPGGRFVPLLAYPRPSFERTAELRLPARGEGGDDARAFDGREPGCVWHRLLLDACIPPEGGVRFESRAADTLAELAALPWEEEPAPYLRATGPELPWRAAPLGGPAGQAGTWELLFQNARGRYLQLRATLAGNGRTTPRLHGLRLYYQRFSYLSRYLPAVWREDPASASFLDRFLANPEGTLTEIEGRVADVQVLFDTRTVPADFLEWLAGWMGATLDAAWDEPKRRFFLANALRMYASRGTREGIVRALRLALEECVDPHLFDDCACGGSDSAGSASTAVAATSTASATTTGSASSAGSAGGCGCGGTSGSGGGSARSRFSVRVVERFLSRTAPGVAYGDVTALAGPGTTATALPWSPAQGAEPLHARWREWLAGRYGSVGKLNAAWGTELPSLDSRLIRLAATAPPAAQAADWSRFLREGLGFTYVPPAGAELPLWHDFLAARHRSVEALNAAWKRTGTAVHPSFEAVPFPTAMPAGGEELGDWIAFASVVVPMHRAAHRFTVLVPVFPGEDAESQRRRRDLARRIAEIEKPAHTVVEARLYWAAMRVGEARLGTDTLLGQGSRFTALELGRGALGAALLAWTEPWNTTGRRVVGRDPVAVRRQPRAIPARSR